MLSSKLPLLTHRPLPKHGSLCCSPSTVIHLITRDFCQAVPGSLLFHKEAFLKPLVMMAAATNMAQDSDLEALALRVVDLEKAAAEAHQRAQELNIKGDYKAAQEAYAEMHKLEDEASQLSKQVGCVQCVLGAPTTTTRPPPDGTLLVVDGTAAQGTDSPCPQYDERLIELYSQRYMPPPWPASPTLSGTSVPGHDLSVEQRAIGSMRGAAVADAAAMGVHWIYDLDLIRQLETERREQGEQGLEFMNPPRSPFYTYQSGRNSPYGEQAFLLLKSLADCGGCLDCLAYAEAFSAHFGSDAFDGYRDVSCKGFLRNYSKGLLPPLTGADDAQANCTARLAPLVATFVGDPRLMQLVEMVTRVTQNTDAACAWASVGAAILEGIMLGSSAEHAVRSAVHDLEQEAGVERVEGRFKGLWGLSVKVAEALKLTLSVAESGVSVAEGVIQLGGRNCHMPNALTTPLLVVLATERKSNATQPEADFIEAIRSSLKEGGCCASRSSYVGACVGALRGVKAIPNEWSIKYLKIKELEESIERICRGRSAAATGNK